MILILDPDIWLLSWVPRNPRSTFITLVEPTPTLIIFRSSSSILRISIVEIELIPEFT